MSTISPLAREAAEKLFQYLENRDWRKEDKLMHLKTFWEHFAGFEQVAGKEKLEGITNLEQITRAENNRLRTELEAHKQYEKLSLETDSLIASCDCLTKTNDIQYHKPGCKYRLIAERNEARVERDEFAKLYNERCDWHGQCKRERDQADRRAGAAERKLATANKEVCERMSRAEAVAMDLSAKLDTAKKALSYYADIRVSGQNFQRAADVISYLDNPANPPKEPSDIPPVGSPGCNCFGSSGIFNPNRCPIHNSGMPESYPEPKPASDSISEWWI